MKKRTNRYKIHKNREIILDRRETVKDLFYIQNYSIREIAKRLNWGATTIWEDIEAIRESFEKQIIIVDRNEIWRRIWQTRTKVLKRLWENANNCHLEGKASDERRALIAIDNIRQKDIHTLQELKFIDKPKDRLEVSEPENYKFEIEEIGARNKKRGN